MSWKYLNKKNISEERALEVLRRPIITEKSTLVGEHNKYVFEVAADASKPEVKQAIEKLFKVSVTAVNTINQNGKTKRFRGRLGQQNGKRKAIATLKEGDVIDVSSGL